MSKQNDGIQYWSEMDLSPLDILMAEYIAWKSLNSGSIESELSRSFETQEMYLYFEEL